jgi:hypothetical protein
MPVGVITAVARLGQAAFAADLCARRHTGQQPGAQQVSMSRRIEPDTHDPPRSAVARTNPNQPAPGQQYSATAVASCALTHASAHDTQEPPGPEPQTLRDQGTAQHLRPKQPRALFEIIHTCESATLRAAARGLPPPSCSCEGCCCEGGCLEGCSCEGCCSCSAGAKAAAAKAARRLLRRLLLPRRLLLLLLRRLLRRLLLLRLRLFETTARLRPVAALQRTTRGVPASFAAAVEGVREGRARLAGGRRALGRRSVGAAVD